MLIGTHKMWLFGFKGEQLYSEYLELVLGLNIICSFKTYVVDVLNDL